MDCPEKDHERKMEKPKIEAVRKLLAEQALFGPGFLTSFASGACIGGGNGEANRSAPTLADIALLIGKVKPPSGLED